MKSIFVEFRVWQHFIRKKKQYSGIALEPKVSGNWFCTCICSVHLLKFAFGVQKLTRFALLLILFRGNYPSSTRIDYVSSRKREKEKVWTIARTIKIRQKWLTVFSYDQIIPRATRPSFLPYFLISSTCQAGPSRGKLGLGIRPFWAHINPYIYICNDGYNGYRPGLLGQRPPHASLFNYGL